MTIIPKQKIKTCEKMKKCVGLPLNYSESLAVGGGNPNF